MCSDSDDDDVPALPPATTIKPNMVYIHSKTQHVTAQSIWGKHHILV